MDYQGKLRSMVEWSALGKDLNSHFVIQACEVWVIARRINLVYNANTSTVTCKSLTLVVKLPLNRALSTLLWSLLCLNLRSGGKDSQSFGIATRGVKSAALLGSTAKTCLNLSFSFCLDGSVLQCPAHLECRPRKIFETSHDRSRLP